MENEGQYCCKFGEVSLTTPFGDCIEERKNFNGTDIETLNEIANPKNCQISCQNDDSCNSWSWENTKVCHLKDVEGFLETDQSFISGPKNCPSS